MSGRKIIVIAASAALCLSAPGSVASAGAADGNGTWPVLKAYDRDHLARISLPLGGIGTGTVGLGGRGNLRDWEIMNRPAKGYTPSRGQQTGPFFAVFAAAEGGRAFVRALEGPLPVEAYENSHGSTATNHGLPRFGEASFAAAYPLGQVLLSDPAAPLEVRLEAFNPLVPCDVEASGLPAAVLRYVLINKTEAPLRAAVCGSLPNFIGADGSSPARDWKGDPLTTGCKANRIAFRSKPLLSGLYLTSEGVDVKSPAWGTIALTVLDQPVVSRRTGWPDKGWGSALLDFWDDFAADGALSERPVPAEDMPMGSLAAEVVIPAGESRAITFLLTWHFPNRMTWTPKDAPEDLIGNFYTTLYADAWDAAEKIAPRLPVLETATVDFVRAFCGSDLPAEVKEAALFNLSTLRTQTCFRTPDGLFFGFEGCSNSSGCCWGSCTHVWNYEQATAHLFGRLARSMREVEFGRAVDANGLMSFRVGLPLDRARGFGRAAADGQMGCIMKAHRDWRLSGDDAFLRRLWPNVRKALEFCWIKGGWDADRDGVMEGCQHNTMDVEYYGPNPQMGIWYLGALRAGEEMAGRVGDRAFAAECRRLFERGRAWIDANLFNGEYYVHEVRPPRAASDIAPGLVVGMGASDVGRPDYQLGQGCLVDQLVGQFMAHVGGLGYLVDPTHVRTTLANILKYNRREGFNGHFNCLRSFVLGDETALLMASYPKGRPENPFPYFTEVMTGFEYVAAIGLLFEGETAEGVRVIRDIRNRYDGRKRSPFDEAECGHHYARAMASWAAVPALSGFRYSGVEKALAFAPAAGTWFWSSGDAWGTCRIEAGGDVYRVGLEVRGGRVGLGSFELSGAGHKRWPKPQDLRAGATLEFEVRKAKGR
ncbi:MAG: hypothetical protein JW742_01975 [Candidatus Aminicenantes bacterium]|nr:hypothetical protein [Candidatus Aminicenantes bacterium]